MTVGAVFGVSSSYYAGELRRELTERNVEYARRHDLQHVAGYGEQPIVCYPENGSRHGNFLPGAWRAIVRNPAWRRRMEKVHAQARTSLPPADRRWRELDSAISSDALLMNIFCAPGIFRSGQVAALLGIGDGVRPEFGVMARGPLAVADAKGRPRFDRTEVDMRLGGLLVEAKLTESDFQSAPLDVLQTYRDFAAVFDRRSLPSARGRILGYQLIRNVLAAHDAGCAFCVLLDQRRPDLLEAWFAVLRAIHYAELRVRCKALTWQELASVVPPSLQRFLVEKYGIVSGGR